MWFGDCFDGVKHVCMDKIMNVIKEGKCLVYSFGLSMDWSFERYGNMGCEVSKEGGIQNLVKNQHNMRKLLYFVNKHGTEFSKIDHYIRKYAKYLKN